MKPLIAIENISKTFYGVKALDNISLTLLPGEVHCLAGQNGCGKSTLIKIISGVYQPDAGAVINIDEHTFSICRR
jgi:simple sugar transport system ATP-binding protein